MKRLLVAGSILAAISTIPIRADVDDLSGGALIAHYAAEIEYTDFPPAEGWCQRYAENFAITGSAEQVSRIDTEDWSIWFVIAAWTEPKEFCVVEFGFGDYDPGIYTLVDHGYCIPPGEMALELSTPDWPGPNSGTAFTLAGISGWAGNYVPVYFFIGYAYEEGIIPLGVNPPPHDQATFTSCQTLPLEYDVDCLGGMGILQAGGECHHEGTHACCVGAVCSMVTESDCAAMGGVWQPDLTSCEPNPCLPSPVQGADWGRIKALYR
ncbi:hypothetical protein ACFL6M_00090 [Candidatus Eisenbacteria bacterium]|uniref:Carbohydrate-binding domain-containing protein n=1 Tax=Eiseniibacteriota bacterium TaxID=2212470 RepID=A0ABV6YI14_UNCEI